MNTLFKFRKYWQISGVVLTFLLIHSCMLSSSEVNPESVSVTSASIENEQLILQGTALSAVRELSLTQQDSTLVPVQIISRASNRLVAAFANGTVFKPIGAVLVMSTASAQTTSTLTVNLNGITVIMSNGNVGIGTTSPAGNLDVVATGLGAIRGIVSSQFSTDTGSGMFVGKKARGTLASPTAVASGDYLTGYVPAGYDGSAYQVTGYAAFVANGSIAPGAVPTDFVVNTGSASYGNERLRVTSAGNVGIGTMAPVVPLHVAGAARFTSANVPGTNSGVVISSQTASGWTDGLQLGDTGANTYKFIQSNGGTLSLNPAGGNVGIGAFGGTAVPTTTLQVAGEITPATDNTYSLGTGALRFTAVYAANGTIQTSDAREKKNIQESDLGLNFINKLRPVSYNWKSGPDNDLHYGLIAQETEKAVLELHKQDPSKNTPIIDHDQKTDRYGLKYAELISPIIKAIQELNDRLVGVESQAEQEKAAQDQEIQRLRRENAEIKDRLEKIEKVLNSK